MAGTPTEVQEATRIGSLVSGFDYQGRLVLGPVVGISWSGDRIVFILVEQPNTKIVRLYPESDPWTVAP